MPSGPLILLEQGAGRTYIETGLLVMRDTRHRVFGPHSLFDERELLNNNALMHEWVHYLQSITCAAVHTAAREMLRASGEIINSAAQGEISAEAHRKLAELKKSIYNRREEESVLFFDHPGANLILPVPESYNLSLRDLMEGVAVLEGFKLCTKNAEVNDFLAFRDQVFSGQATNPYRWSFNWLAQKIGPHVAYELLSPLTFFALQTSNPQVEFVRIGKKLAEEKKLDYQALTDAQAFAEFASTQEWTSWLHHFEQNPPKDSHPTLGPALLSTLQEIGYDTLVQLGVTPNRLTDELMDSLYPPLIACSGVDEVELNVSHYALDGLADRVLNWTAMVGAAERLTIDAQANLYQFCPHNAECPYYQNALCHANFAPPAVGRSHEQCRFPSVLQQEIKLEPNALWEAAGLDPMNLPEFLTALESIGEAGLWELVKKQRAALTAWLGSDAYESLEGKAHMLEDKVQHVMRTNKMQDMIEAKMLHGALVGEIRNLVNQSSDSS